MPMCNRCWMHWSSTQTDCWRAAEAGGASAARGGLELQLETTLHNVCLIQARAGKAGAQQTRYLAAFILRHQRAAVDGAQFVRGEMPVVVPQRRVAVLVLGVALIEAAPLHFTGLVPAFGQQLGVKVLGDR